MATTVLIRLSGPLQSYGASSHWTERETGPRPTKSAVAGLIANALGRHWSADLSDLRAMTFAVRADRPGHLLTDDQTAGGGTFPSYAFETSAPGETSPTTERRGRRPTWPTEPSTRLGWGSSAPRSSSVSTISPTPRSSPG
ncbi:type I-E CRISPR-associated protein Cas5/CasD [Streptomyces sp. AM 4-1-1]|uniref:type I-E CRISPR-associated protein Cas5/CasD n=1 Tax=Streptomyces sp. AM 4-1-1 TaxID=3028710 RepID=UPI0023BA23B6|nr:type I-E CRISPR-associated protein Cas5/CasD [Streptomyces sp. AM 4-1-1]WEH31948.1 type I-E CRISPR-associated protein Cas5/CasD [Streptomyces sp. AM 4-1-1]